MKGRGAARQPRSLRIANAMDGLQEQFRQRLETEASRPLEKVALRVFFGSAGIGRAKMRQIERGSYLADAAAMAT